MHSTVNSKSNLMLFPFLGFIYIHKQMMGETSGPSAQDIRMASFEEKFNDLLNFVRLLVKRDTESEKQVEDIDKGTSEDNTGGHSDTNLGPQLVQPLSTPAENSLLYSKVFIFDFPRYRPLFGECCVCSSISFPFRDTSCVCVGTCVRVCM
jgi:hypothetical protein